MRRNGGRREGVRRIGIQRDALNWCIRDRVKTDAIRCNEAQRDDSIRSTLRREQESKKERGTIPQRTAPMILKLSSDLSCRGSRLYLIWGGCSPFLETRSDFSLAATKSTCRGLKGILRSAPVCDTYEISRNQEACVRKRIFQAGGDGGKGAGGQWRISCEPFRSPSVRKPDHPLVPVRVAGQIRTRLLQVYKVRPAREPVTRDVHPSIGVGNPVWCISRRNGFRYGAIPRGCDSSNNGKPRWVPPDVSRLGLREFQHTCDARRSGVTQRCRTLTQLTKSRPACSRYIPSLRPCGHVRERRTLFSLSIEEGSQYLVVQAKPPKISRVRCKPHPNHFFVPSRMS